MTNQAWLDQVKEEIIDPDRPIIDPHHHLWDYEENVYLYEELHQDTGSGHNIVKTVFVECGSEYLTSGPEEFRPVGETAFVVEQAKGARAAQGQAEIAGIVSHVNLMLGDRVDEILDRHAEAGQGLFRGIRHSAAFDPSPEIRKSHSGAPEGLYLRDDFRAGFACLGRRGLTFDAWNYHPQISELTSLARAIPETTIIFDHFGGPIGIGPYEGKRGAIFTQWKDDISQLASLPNVVAKLGGLAMPVNGWGWHNRDTPATSDEIVTAHKPWYQETIEAFGVDRCMFESNFPVDRRSASYHVVWNAFKKMVQSFSEDEKHALFYATAERIYRL